jgi:hypothetical protein
MWGPARMGETTTGTSLKNTAQASKGLAKFGTKISTNYIYDSEHIHITAGGQQCHDALLDLQCAQQHRHASPRHSLTNRARISPRAWAPQERERAKLTMPHIAHTDDEHD